MHRRHVLLACAGLCLALATTFLPGAAAVTAGSTTSTTARPSASARPSITSPAVTSVTLTTATTASTRPRKKRRTKAIMPLHRAALAHGTATDPMTYRGGALMTAPARVHLLWYGTWTGSTAVTILLDLVKNLGGSAYAGTNATFTDKAGRRATTDISLGSSTYVPAKRGARLSDAGVRTLVHRLVSGGTVPSDPTAIYAVITSADIKETSGFGSRYCGWHTHGLISGDDLKYLFVGDPTTQAPRTCVPQLGAPPNGDFAADAMASTLVHEIDETLTDPDLDGWLDQWDNENGDKCAWTYGLTYPTADGGIANVHLGRRDYLIQRNWVVSSPQRCALVA